MNANSNVPFLLVFMGLFTVVAIGLLVMRALAKFAGLDKPVSEDAEPETKPKDDKSAGKPLVSLVLLLKEPRYLDDTIVKQVAGKVFNHDFTGTDDKATDFVVGEHAPFFLKFNGEIFLIHNLPAPYVENPQAAAREIKELRTRKAVGEHKAWMSVDYLSIGEAPPDLKPIYQSIGKLVAEFADENCLAILSPATSRINVYDPELDAKLRGPDPLQDFTHRVFAPVTSVSSDDPRMKAAVEESRRRWPEFVSAFETRAPGEMFSVKAPFSDGTHTEFMWVTVTGIENDIIYGKLDSKPVNVSSVKEDDRVKIKLSELNDWIFKKGKNVVGGFTTKVLMNVQKLS